MTRMSKCRLPSDRLGVSTIAIAVVAILVIAAAGVGVYYMTKNAGGGDSEEGASFANPGIGSVVNYNVKVLDSDSSGTITVTYVAENTKDYVVNLKLTLNGSMEGAKTVSKIDEFAIGSDRFMLPDDAVAVGAETIQTCDGKVDTTKYTSASSESTFWVGNEDSGKKNQAIYKIESNSVTGKSVSELTSYSLKKHVAYVPSPVIGTEYARYVSDTGSSIQAKYVAESSDYYCIGLDTGEIEQTYILLSKTAGKTPLSFADKGASTVTIGDKTYDTHGYAKRVMDMAVDGASLTTVDLRLDIYTDGVPYKVTTVSAMGEMTSEKTYTIVL